MTMPQTDFTSTNKQLINAVSQSSNKRERERERERERREEREREREREREERIRKFYSIRPKPHLKGSQ